MLNFGASKPRVKGGARAPGAPPLDPHLLYWFYFPNYIQFLSIGPYNYRHFLHNTLYCTEAYLGVLKHFVSIFCVSDLKIMYPYLDDTYFRHTINFTVECIFMFLYQ